MGSKNLFGSNKAHISVLLKFDTEDPSLVNVVVVHVVVEVVWYYGQ